MLLRCTCLLNFLVLTSSGAVRFTNLKCVEFDALFANFETCNLKIVQRGVVGMNIYVKLHKIPVTNVTINLSLHKKANGFRPFLYNITQDFCMFLKNRKKTPLFKLIFDAALKNTNINHTCPFNHDVIVRNWILKVTDFKFLPLPEGEYLFKLKVGAYNDWKADVHFFFSIKD